MRASTITTIVLFALVCSEMYFALKLRRPSPRRRPAMNQKSRRPVYRPKQLRVRGTCGTNTRHKHHDTHHTSSATRNGKSRGSSPTSTVTGNSDHLSESTVGSAPMPHPGMPMSGYPDYGGGMGAMGSMMALQMLSGSVASMGEAGNGIARTVLENRPTPTGGESNDEDSAIEKGQETDKKTDNKEKDKNKANGTTSGHGRARSG